MEPRSEVLAGLEVQGSKIAYFACGRGLEMTREACPNTQIWLVFQGKWTETQARKSRLLAVAEAVAYAPKEPCRRTAEEPILALSVQIPRNVGLHSRQSLKWEQIRALWQLAHHVGESHSDPFIIEELLLNFEPSQPNRLSDRAPTWALRARDIVHDEVDNLPCLSSLAGRVGISPNHLCAQFRRSFGQTLSQYARRLRLNRAIVELGGSKVDDIPIWAEAGFFDASHFWQSCRKEIGLTPREIHLAMQRP